METEGIRVVCAFLAICLFALFILRRQQRMEADSQKPPEEAREQNDPLNGPDNES